MRRVALEEVEKAAGRQEVRHHPRPSAQVGQPAEDPVGGVDDVPGPGQHLRQPQDVGLDEARVRCDIGGQRVGDLHRPGGEVDPGHSGAQPGPREGVESYMAL